jgi:bleomycin hydrolase
VALDDVVNSIKNSLNNGYTVLWYGDINEQYVFVDEEMAIVPVGGMPEVEVEEGEEASELNPVPEKDITVEMRSEVVEELIVTEQEYLLIYGINQDQDGNEYFEGKYVCKSGDVSLNLSPSFVKLNTIYLMMNKHGLPETLKGKLGL